MKTVAQIETLLPWGTPKRLHVNGSEMDLRTAIPTEAFWGLYRSNKSALYEAGVSVKKVDGVWEARWWKPLDEVEQQAKQTAEAASRATDNTEIELPVPDRLSYLPYQKAGIAYALARQGVLFGDEMGLGKTIQAIGTVNADKSLKKILVVCPAGLKLNWCRELKKWLVRPLTVDIVNGKGWVETDIVIIAYSMLEKHHDHIHSTVWDLVVCDEVHNIKNPDARRTQEIAGLAARKGFHDAKPALGARRRLGLSGTPMVNRPIELYSTMSWLRPDLWPLNKRYSYAVRYCNLHNNGYGLDFSGASNLDELQHLLRQHLMVRRLKKDVLTELPPKRRVIIELAVDGKIRDLLNRQIEMHDNSGLDELQAEVDVLDAGDDRAAYEAAVLKLNDKISAMFDELSKIRHEVGQAKVAAATEFLTDQLEDSDEPLIIFAWHHDVINALMTGLAQFNPVKLTGEMSDTQKQASVDKFQTDPKCRVFVGNIQAAGVGITLTRSSQVRFVEQDWVPGNLSQAEDRVHRIGQHNSVLVQHILLEGSLDVRMAQRVIAKQQVLDEALDTEHKQEVQAHVTEVALKAPRTLPKVTDDKIAAAHYAVQLLAGVCDGARSLDDVGFNRYDAAFGKSLAHLPQLTERQGRQALNMVRKYRRQLPEDLYERCGYTRKDNYSA